MPKTFIFHLKRNPEIKVPIDLITIDDCKKMIGKTYYLIHKDYEPSGKPFQVVVDSVYAEDDCELMTICVCHRLDKNSDEKIEIGFECLFESEEKMREGLEHRSDSERRTPQNLTSSSSSLPKSPAKGRHFLF